jgi:hypothetical protein
MPFNISSFKENGLVYGGARPSLFSVTLNVPQGIGIDNVSVDKFRFMCNAAELPPSSISAIEIPYFGRKIKIGGDRSFGDWTVNIMNDEDFAVKALFEKWSNAINRMQSNVRDPNVSTEEYKQDLICTQYSKDGVKIREYRIIGAFPTVVSGITLDWNNPNSVETFGVTFAYDYWVPEIETSDKKAGGVNAYRQESELDGPLGPE